MLNASGSRFSRQVIEWAYPMDQALYNKAAALTPMAISTTITMMANQSRRMAGDSFIAGTGVKEEISSAETYRASVGIVPSVVLGGGLSECRNGDER